jgi:glyoxylase-like metal-dependent hydrolase (beta-lactamase superfamily II)
MQRNIYYVGTVDLSSFLVTSPQGHVLIDTGVEENADAVLDNIRALRFDVKRHPRHPDDAGALRPCRGACTPQEGIGGQSPRIGL